MTSTQDARKISDEYVEDLLLQKLDVKMKEQANEIIFEYIPLPPQRGGGYQITFDKVSGKIVKTVHYQ